MDDEMLVARVAGALMGRLNNMDAARETIKEIRRCGYLIVSQREMDVLTETIAVLQGEIKDAVHVQLVEAAR